MSGILYMGEKFGPLACHVVSSSEEVSGGPHLRWVNIGHRHHAATKKHCDLMSVYFVVLCFPAINGFDIQSMTKDKRDIFFTAKICNPVPCENAFHGHNDVPPKWSNGLQKDVGIALDVPVRSEERRVGKECRS